MKPENEGEVGLDEKEICDYCDGTSEYLCYCSGEDVCPHIVPCPICVEETTHAT